MLQLLIVDDEQVERDGMKAILHKSFPSLVIKEARNGDNAIEMAAKMKPDLILMDIKMPGINGLEAMEQIMEDHPNTKFIMVTAYDTFDYMRQALKLGASDYLLKPSKAKDIVEIVGKVLKEIVIEQKARARNRRQEEVLQQTMAVLETDVVTQLLFEHVHEIHVAMLVELLDIQTNRELFVLTIRIPAGEEQLYSTVKEVVRQSGTSLVGALYANQLPIIMFRNPETSFRTQAISLARQILSITNQSSQRWFIGIGSVYPSIEQVRSSYQEALMATMDTTVPARYSFYSEVPAASEDVLNQKISVLKKEIPDRIRLGQWDLVKTELFNVIQLFENTGIPPLQTQQRLLETLWFVSNTMRDIGIESNSPFFTFQAHDYRQLRTGIAQLLQQMRLEYTEYYQRLEADTIEQIKQYIMSHSHEEISLETLGDIMGLSPIYISKMFKEKMGINYIDFLTNYRIERAKKLMREPNRSIKEIAIEVGYHEPNYFSKVFKKLVQVSPKEYQNSLLGKKE
ncbi:response regulator [Ornithinibacillus contaminans]|uniref:response regulator n=1 Tax=Ornithinibacillus contaminans TaxID=694055 RepID=UPI00064DB74E|nr:response regulator [Ornithinibacillus contaminans]